VEWLDLSTAALLQGAIVVTFGFAMQRQKKNVAFALLHPSFCITAVQALLCSMTKMLSRKAAVKYHRTGKSTIQARNAST
jgi:hypothetical protein